MNKSKNKNESKLDPSNEKASSEKSNQSEREQKQQPEKQDGLRETVESIVVAFILAFLFRAFEAEAFVIPTGSMAPTLYGRHKDVTCDQCGYHFSVGASDEVDNDFLKRGERVHTAFCPNCRYANDILHAPVFKGDRILVNKFPFEIGNPDRWDVTVFKYPEEPKTNYIKRLVGLPGETLLIERGDLFSEQKDGTRKILRKDDPNKQKVLQLSVYDNDHQETILHEKGWPKRWSAVTQNDAERSIAGWSEETTGWESLPDLHAFRLKSDQTKDGRLRWIRYRHFLPSPDDWNLDQPLANDDAPPLPTGSFDSAKPQLITDLCEYNDYIGGSRHELDAPYWVGDLTLSCNVEVTEVRENSQLLFELNEGVRRYRCTIDVNTGEAVLSHNVELNLDEDEEVEIAKASTNLTGTGEFQIRFANVDDRLCLWIDGSLIDFGEAAAYELPQTANPNPQEEDLIPVGIAARGISVTVSHLLLERDIYYRGEDDNKSNHYERDSFRRALTERLDDPLTWGEKYTELSHLDQGRFVIGEDEYFMLGDNSPRSKDSRLWYHPKTVPRHLLVGKAFYVYWPHGVPFMNDGNGFPNDEGQPKAEQSVLRNVPGFDGKPFFYHRSLQAGEGQPRGQSIYKTDYPRIRIPFYPHIGQMRRIR